MKQAIYQVDAFTSAVFGGNPAAVCPLEAWLDSATLQAIAAENNLSETAFFVDGGDAYHLRWFTPQVEVDLCGHATLASAFVLSECLGVTREALEFETASGRLRVTRDSEGRFVLDLPARAPAPWEAPPALAAGLGGEPEQVLMARDCLALFGSEREVRQLAPDSEALKAIDCLGVIVSAPGDAADVDFVSRFFAPRAGIAEDPVTGSAHCTLTPYWAKRLGKNRLAARQVSARGGELFCELRDDRVLVAGEARLYMEGSLTLPD